MEMKEGIDYDAKSQQSLVDRVWSVGRVVLSTWFGSSLILLFLIHRYSSWVQRFLLFSPIVRWPLKLDFNDILKCGVVGARNFYVTTKDNVKLGAWHILPKSLCERCKLDENDISCELFEEMLQNGEPIVLYMHGNSGTRASFHRVELYRLLQNMNFHIIAFDYRSFADSSDVFPDEVGVVEDAKTMLCWVTEKKGNVPLYIWGHSLGTAVASRTVAELENEGIHVNGVILESPFNNLKDEIRAHPLATCLKYMIGFDTLLVDPIIKNGISFKSDEYLVMTSVNVLILHAEDDWIVPCTLGRKLYRYLLLNRSEDKVVKYVEFSSFNRYGHKYICHSENLPKIIRLFITGEFGMIEPVYK